MVDVSTLGAVGALDAVHALAQPHALDSWASTWTLLADGAEAAADAAKDLNFFDQYVETIERLIVSLHDFISSTGTPYAYAASIFFFTLGVKLLLLPLNYKQMEGQVAMQKLQPKTKKLQKWFSENQNALAEETSRLYSDNEVNPLAGCLPAFAQIPVFIGLYRAIIALSKDNVLDEGFLWLPSLEGPVSEYGKGIGWLTENWVNGAPSLGWHDTLCYLTIPVILVVSQSLSMRLLSPPVDDADPQVQQTQQILKFLPLLIGWFSLSAPAGLGLYWLFNNIITTGQSVALKALLGVGKPQVETTETSSTEKA